MDILLAAERLNCLTMSTKTSTETRREVTRKGDLVIVKEVEKTTIIAPGKEPEVKEVTRVEEFKGEEGFKRLPEDIRRQLEQPSTSILKPLNKNATRGNFLEDCLAEHNKYRNAHGSQPLKLKPELVKISEERAKELAEKDEMSSRPDDTYGENLSCFWSNDPDHFVEAAEIIAKWYEEEKNYKYDEEPKDLNSGHFTQMIWAACKDFGIAAAKSDSNKIYVVATYNPPGNFVGQFKDNVHPAGSKGAAHTAPHTAAAAAGAAPAAPAAAAPAAAAPAPAPAPAAPTGKAQGQKSNKSGTEKGKVLDLNEECVMIHNRFRAKHGVPPLTFSQEVANYAQEWADELARKDRFEHRTTRKYGENLYCYMSTDPNATVSATDACNSWYGEIKDFNFSAEPKTLTAGHFTQMIWKTTKEVGMGKAKTKKGLHIIVANYNPPGNFVGKFLENVPRPYS